MGETNSHDDPEEACDVEAPSKSPAPALVDARLELRAFTQACEGVGGDLFDYHLSNGGRLFFSLGDVSGKGMPAALLMSATQVTIRTLWLDNSTIVQ